MAKILTYITTLENMYINTVQLTTSSLVLWHNAGCYDFQGIKYHVCTMIETKSRIDIAIIAEKGLYVAINFIKQRKYSPECLQQHPCMRQR